MKLALGLLTAALLLPISGCGKSFDALLSQSREAHARGNYTKVIDNLNLALPRWNSSIGVEKKAEAYQLLGQAYQALKKSDQASEAYREAIKLSDTTYESAYALGIISMGAGQYEAARDMFQVALRMKQNDPLALLGLGDSLYMMDQPDQAEEIYKRLIRTSPGVESAMANLEKIQQKSKKPAPKVISPGPKHSPPTEPRMRLKKQN